METRTLMQLEQEEQSSQMSRSVQLSSQIKKNTFSSSDEEASYSNIYPNIPADLMSVKEILNMDNFPRHRTWEILNETLNAEEEYHRDQWTMFGNEAEKVELDVIRNQHLLRMRVDKLAIRKQAEKKASAHLKYLERLSQKAPDFPIPLRAHTVWEGMTVTLSCTVQGCPPPKVTWYKDDVPLRVSDQPWNYSLKQRFGLNSLEIRRCSPDDAGKYKVVAKSPLGEAMTFGTLLVNSYQGVVAGSEHSQTPALKLEQEAQFGNTFPPTWVEEGDSLTLQCTFTSALLPFQQDVSWFRDGIQLHQSSTLEIKTLNNKSSITLKDAQKDHEGVYTTRLRTGDNIQEHSAFVYVKDASAAVVGGPASPLAVQVSDINKDYVFLTWQPPSADGASAVEGYYVERYDLGHGKWVRCNVHIQKMCCYPVCGLKEGTLYQFRVRAVNQAGAGRPSKATEPVLTADPLEHTRTMVVKVDRGRTVTITKDEIEGQVKAPFPPTNVHASEVSDTYVVLSWAEPEPRGREPLTFYVERSLVGKSSWELASMDMMVNSPRFTVFDLVKGKQYCFRVRSINKYGVSDPSEPSTPISLGKPQAVPAPPHSVMAIRDTDTSVLLQWKEPKERDDIQGYYLYYTETGKQDWKTVNNKPVTKTRFTVHGLKNRREYVFRVKSVSRAGNSNYSDESRPILVKSAISVPSAPSGITLLLCTGSEMVLGWRAPTCNGGDPVRGYYLDKREKDTDTWREVNVKSTKERQFKVCNLTSGHFYQFHVCAANIAGVGKPSEASEAFLCEKWTMPEPGCPCDVEFREVRNNSLALLWAAPLYEGQSPVTGYLLEISQGDISDNWTALNERPISETHYKVSGLQAGQTYRLRVSAVNEAGVGRASLPTEPITAQTRPGAKDIEIGVDNDGFIFLGYEADEKDDESMILWSKNYTESIDAGRAREETKKNGSVLTFMDPSEEDLGLYTVEMSDNPNLSSSYDFTAEDLEQLKELSWQVRNPLIALKSGWQVDVSEKGDVRLWLQTESLSDAAELRLIFNDREITSTPHRKITFDKAKGLVEIVLEQLSQEDEGQYTAQLKDGRAKNQFTFVFVDQKFRQTLALADKNRRDHQRKSGPYFQEYLSWSVNEDCEVIIKCKVTNTNKDTSLKWFKEGVAVTQLVYEQSSGVSTLTIPQVTKKESGSYRAVVSDGRGEDVSILELLDDEYDKLLQQLSKQCALSASPLKIQSTAEGFKLYCSLKYYISYMKTSWYFKEKRIDQEAKTKPGSNMQNVWIEIFNPTEKDKGKYTLEMFDGKETHKRSLDLSEQVFADALLEYQRLKQAAIAEKNRAKVTKGLPDVVAIMEGKSLCLTCYIDGEPTPEIVWLRNDKEIVNETHFTLTKEPKCSTININNVSLEDSGKYSIFVRNQYGSETVDVTVSVYMHGEKPPIHAVLMGLD
ncbi:myomesin-3 isoform X2 [Etheostoma cragini]|uniref:myomesin-3 isoform X1 n=1 Tax=Etheostoma cragini TaxID=417921 RepID=UPI00155E62A2|nr:myomesin-3 isoform X1 [Etheostoma cragini]XP_034730714.1 myomesin-3 isoform X2 [Etheostoma cragini]